MSTKLLVELCHYPLCGCRVCSDGPGFIPEVGGSVCSLFIFVRLSILLIFFEEATFCFIDLLSGFPVFKLTYQRDSIL